MKDENFLSRWSRRKSASKAGPAGPTTDAVPAQAGTQLPSPPEGALPRSRKGEGEQPLTLHDDSPAQLPPVDSLTLESDFTPFMQPGVDPGLRRQALKTLLQDPRFNVMDGLDVYIDDYSKPDPLPAGWLEKMNQVKSLGIFTEPAETAPAVPGPSGERAQKAMEEQPVEPPVAVEGSDTSSARISPSQVGKSPPEREGDEDVLV
jgi:hypothetical protein